MATAYDTSLFDRWTSEQSADNCPRGPECGLIHLKDHANVTAMLRIGGSLTFADINSASYMEHEHRMHTISKEVARLERNGLPLKEACKLACEWEAANYRA